MTEQVETSPNSGLISEIENLNKDFEAMSPEEKKLLGEDPQGYGKDFWSDVIEAIKNLNSANSLSEEDKETVSKFKDSLSKFPQTYPLFKPTLDKVIPVATASSDATEDDYVSLPEEEPAPTEEEPTATEEEPAATEEEPTATEEEPAPTEEEPAPTEEEPTAPSTPTKSGGTPKIKFNGSMVDVYVDAGGGRYVPANEDQLGDPNTQLYVKNPKRGQSEYLKPTYVKVRREGNELRRQSQFGGALGSLSNLFGDIGNTLKK